METHRRWRQSPLPYTPTPAPVETVPVVANPVWEAIRRTKIRKSTRLVEEAITEYYYRRTPAAQPLDAQENETRVRIQLENNIIQARMDAAIAQYNAGWPYHSPHLEGDNLPPPYDVQEEL